MNRVQELLMHQKHQMLDLLQELSLTELEQAEVQMVQSPTREAYYETTGRYPGGSKLPHEAILEDMEKIGFVDLAYLYVDNGESPNLLDELQLRVGEEAWETIWSLPPEAQFKLSNKFV